MWQNRSKEHQFDCHEPNLPAQKPSRRPPVILITVLGSSFRLKSYFCKYAPSGIMFSWMFRVLPYPVFQRASFRERGNGHMRIAVPREQQQGEARVALVPESVKKLVAAGV